MNKVITIAIEIETEHEIDASDFEADDLYDFINHLPSDGTFTVLGFREGDRLSEKPQHFSDRELAERGLPPFAYADDHCGNVIKIERGMDGYFPRPDYHVDSVAELNAMIGVTDAQADAMHHGSMFGWHTPGAWPKAWEKKV